MKCNCVLITWDRLNSKIILCLNAYMKMYVLSNWWLMVQKCWTLSKSKYMHGRSVNKMNKTIFFFLLYLHETNCVWNRNVCLFAIACTVRNIFGLAIIVPIYEEHHLFWINKPLFSAVQNAFAKSFLTKHSYINSVNDINFLLTGVLETEVTRDVVNVNINGHMGKKAINRLVMIFQKQVWHYDTSHHTTGALWCDCSCETNLSLKIINNHQKCVSTSKVLTYYLLICSIFKFVRTHHTLIDALIRV